MSTNQIALDYARRLADAQFWGFLTLKYEAGRIVHMRREENLKPTEMIELPGKNRGEYDSRANNS